MNMKHHLLICMCESVDHQAVLSYFDDDDDCLYLSVHLHNGRSVWQRIKYAFKYVFGYKSRYGAFDEMMLDKEGVTKLRKVLEEFQGPQNAAD